MSRTLTIRLDALDYNRLEGEAKKLGIRPSALATILVRGSLSEMSCWIVGPPLARPKYGTGMPPLPRITGREIVRALNHLGWVLVVQKGSHAQLKHPERGGRVTVPLHAGDNRAWPAPLNTFASRHQPRRVPRCSVRG